MPATPQFILGMQGLALLRGWLTDDGSGMEVRLEAMVRFVRSLDTAGETDWFDAPELAVQPGYGAWAETYDEPGNPIIELEQPVVYQMLGALRSGSVVDAACGTGRHTGFLQSLGHQVVGVDATPEMLAKTRQKAPGARLLLGDLNALPLASGVMDAAVCTLALTHCAGLERPVRELTRVVRSGGTIILSDVHPFLVSLGGQALFRDLEGNRAFVRNHVHLHSDYLAAFAASDLEVKRLVEPRLVEPATGETEPVLSRMARSGRNSLAVEVMQAALVGLPMVIVWELGRR